MPIIGTIASSFQSGVASDYQSIASFNLTSDTASITFSSIPQTFRHLQIRGVARSTRSQSDNIFVRVNGDSTSGNYYVQYQDATTNGGINNAILGSNQTALRIMSGATGGNSDSGIRGAFIFDLVDYVSTSKVKVAQSLSGARNQNDGGVALTAGYHNSTSATTSIVLLPEIGPNFAVGTTISLYGIVG